MNRHGQLIGAASFLLVFLAACGPSAPPPVAATPPAPTPPSDQDRLQKYQDCWGYFNDKKFDLLKDCYDASATSLQIGYGKGGPVSGAETIVGTAQELAKSAPDVRGDAQLILVNGNHIASIQLLKGTNSAPMVGAGGKEVPATNKKFALLFADTVEFAPDALKAVTEVGAMDSVTFASQVGMTKQRARPLASGVASPEIVMAKSDANEKANLDAENTQLAAWGKHDSVGVQALIADNAVLHDMTAAKDGDKKQSGQMDKGYWKAFSDAHIVTNSIWAAGDYVAYSGTFEGTNDGAMPAMGMMKKTGKKVSVPFVGIDKFAAGKIQESWLFFDGAQFGAQLSPASGK